MAYTIKNKRRYNLFGFLFKPYVSYISCYFPNNASAELSAILKETMLNDITSKV